MCLGFGVGMSMGSLCANGMGPFALTRRSKECLAPGLSRCEHLGGEAEKVALS